MAIFGDFALACRDCCKNLFSYFLSGQVWDPEPRGGMGGQGCQVVAYGGIEPTIRDAFVGKKVWARIHPEPRYEGFSFWVKMANCWKYFISFLAYATQFIDISMSDTLVVSFSIRTNHSF